MKVGVASNWPRIGFHNGLYKHDVETLGSITAGNYMINCPMLLGITNSLHKQTGGIRLYEQMFKYVSFLSLISFIPPSYSYYILKYITCNYRNTYIKQNSEDSHFWAFLTDAMEHSP
jgi:hypothetical protein